MNKLKKLLTFLYLKLKYRNKVKISISAKVSKMSIFEGANKIYPNVSFDGELGYGSYIGPESNIQGKIGRFTSIAPNVSVNNGVHPYTYPYVSTSPVFISGRKQNGECWYINNTFEELKFVKGTSFPTVIGNDCWICQNVFITGGVVINDGAVVLPGSVVTKDVPSYSIVGGVPAKVIKNRYSDEDIEFILKTKWWNKDICWLKENANLFSDFEAFKNTYKDFSE